MEVEHIAWAFCIHVVPPYVESPLVCGGGSSALVHVACCMCMYVHVHVHVCMCMYGMYVHVKRYVHVLCVWHGMPVSDVCRKHATMVSRRRRKRVCVSV